MAYNYDDDAPVNQYPRDKVPDCMGYLPIAVTDDGDTLCEQCVLDPTNPVHEAGPNDRHPDGWGVIGWTHSGECEDLTVCAHCNRVLVEAPPPGRWYYHDDDTGMEYWHDGEFTRRQCHDGVGLVTEHHQTYDEFAAMCPNADFVEDQ